MVGVREREGGEGGKHERKKSGKKQRRGREGLMEGGS